MKQTLSLLQQKHFIKLIIVKVKRLYLICLQLIRPAASLSSSAPIALPRPKALLWISLFIYLLWTLCSVQLQFLCYSYAASDPPGSPRIQPHTLPRLNIPSATRAALQWLLFIFYLHRSWPREKDIFPKMWCCIKCLKKKKKRKNESKLRHFTISNIFFIYLFFLT